MRTIGYNRQFFAYFPREYWSDNVARYLSVLYLARFLFLNKFNLDGYERYSVAMPLWFTLEV